MKRYFSWLCALLALGGGIFAWWVDSRNDEPQAAVLVLLIVTFILGFLRPRRAWLWALISGTCLPGGYLVAQMLASPTPMPSPGWYAASLALIPAFIGAYAGALARSMMNAIAIKS